MGDDREIDLGLRHLVDVFGQRVERSVEDNLDYQPSSRARRPEKMRRPDAINNRRA